MSRTTGNKSYIGASSNFGFPLELTIVLKFRSVVLSTSSPLGTFDLRMNPVGNQKLIKITFCKSHCLATCSWQDSLVEDSR